MNLLPQPILSQSSFLLILILFFYSCTLEDGTIPDEFQLAKYVDRMELPNALFEVSGLTYDFAKDLMYCHDDEIGHLYAVNFEEKLLNKACEFSGKGDYEGVSQIGNSIYVITSSGILHEFEIGVKGERKIKSGLTRKNDIEGLYYDSKEKHFLLACRKSASIGEHKFGKEIKAIYSLDIDQMITGLDVFFLIDRKVLRDFVGKDISKGLAHRIGLFSPSGIAKAPEQELYYVLSALGRSLAVFDDEGVLKAYYFLNKKIHHQPEGICFDGLGNLYIANEGNSKTPNIIKYNLRYDNKY